MTDNFILSSIFPDIKIPNISVGEYMLNRLKSFNRESIVLIDGKSNKSLTANQLISQANSVALSLLKRGISKSDIICCFSANNISYSILKFAAYFLGVSIVHSKPNNNVVEFGNIMKNCEPNFIFTSVKNAVIVEKVVEQQNINWIKFISVFDENCIKYINFYTLIEESKNENLSKIPYFNTDPKDDICEIVYTSGTTGIPKGAMFSNYSFLSNVLLILHFNEKYKKNHQTFLCLYSMGHMGGTLLLPTMISRGMTVILHNQSDNFDEILRSIENYKITILTLLLPHGHQLINQQKDNKYDLSSLKYVFQGGTHLPNFIAKAIIEKYNVDFNNVYAMTECMAIVKNISDDYIESSCGQLAPNTKLKIFDINTGENLGANQCGEIRVKSPAVFTGYIKNKTSTEEMFDNEGFLRTGDVGYYDEYGRLFIVDRIKEMIKYGLNSVSPVEIEQQLLRHNSVAEAVVVGVLQPNMTEIPRAYVVTKLGHNVTSEQLQLFVKDTMADFNQLRGGIVFVDKLVRTIMGKTDRRYYRILANE